MKANDLNKFCQIADEMSPFSATFGPEAPKLKYASLVDPALIDRVMQRHAERMTAMTREQLDKYIIGDWSNNPSSTVGKSQADDFSQVLRPRGKSHTPAVQRWLMDVSATTHLEMAANYYKARTYRTPTALRKSNLYIAIQQVNGSTV